MPSPRALRLRSNRLPPSAQDPPPTNCTISSRSPSLSDVESHTPRATISRFSSTATRSALRPSCCNSEESEDTVWQVTQKDGDDATLTLLERTTIVGQQARLVGLVAKLPAGYKFFPLIPKDVAKDLKAKVDEVKVRVPRPKAGG